MRREELQILERHGIHVPAAAVYVEEAWYDNFSLALDAQPALITQPNIGIPAFLTNLVDPEVVRVLVTPMNAVLIQGEVKKGTWTDLTASFPMVEATGEVSSYGDYSENGETGANVNWAFRQSYHFQTITEWGERQLAMYGEAQINYASELNVAAALNMAKFRNDSYFYGINNLRNYGMLNDPNLLATIVPTTKTAGGYTWAVATAKEIYQDFLKLYGQLQTQMGGNIKNNETMTLALSTTLYPNLLKVSEFNVRALDTIMASFPNLNIVQAPEYSTGAGELMQLSVDKFQGIQTRYGAFTEKMRAHPVIQSLSAFAQKKSGGTWGSILRRPIAVAGMLGM